MIVAVFLFTTLFFTSGHHLGTTGTIEEKENPMKNTLLDKGIITPSGEISKDKINLVAGAITQPFAEMVWVTTGGDMETINRLTDVLVSMNTPADRGKLFKIIKMLYGLMGLPFSEEAEPMDAAPDVLEYFIFSFTADFGEIIKDYIVLHIKDDYLANQPSSQFSGYFSERSKKRIKTICDRFVELINFRVFFGGTIGKFNFNIICRFNTVSTLARLPLSSFNIYLWIGLSYPSGKIHEKTMPFLIFFRHVYFR